MTGKISSLSLRYIRVREEDRQESFTTDVAMIREIIKIGIDKTVEIGEYHSVEEYNMDRIIEIALGIIRVIEIILGEEILVEMLYPIRIIGDKTKRDGYRKIIQAIIMKEEGVVIRTGTAKTK